MLGSIGPTEIILVLLIVAPVLFFYFGYRWSSKKSKAAALGVPFRWFYFYTYIRLPLSILADVITLLVLRNIDLVAIGIAIIGVQIAVLFGLSKFRTWALNLNIPLLLGETYLLYSNATSGKETSDGSESLITFVIGLLIWFLPNMLYFEKRRRFFTGPAIPGRVDEEQEPGVGDGGNVEDDRSE
jgi:hypothetical protein